MTFEDLIGKTIIKANLMRRPEYDDKAWLHLGFSGGESCILTATFGGYTGCSEDEYPAFIFLDNNPPENLEKLPA